MSKLCVATRTGGSLKKTEQILRCMRLYPEGVTPKVIALETSINVNTIKSLLPKISGIKKIMRGLYKVVERGDAPLSPSPSLLTDWNFHNCILSSSLSDYRGSVIRTTYSFGLINLEFIISSSGNATLRVASDNPLNVASLSLVFAFMVELLSKHSNALISESDVFVRTIEFNKDYDNIRLDGVKCITLDNLCEQFKLYQKRVGMRVEHKTKVAFTVENIVDMLSSNPNSLEINVRLAEHGKQIARIEHALVVTNNLLYKLVDGGT